VSERNGDKARFQRQRKHKVLHRMRIRELRKALGHDKATRDTPMMSADSQTGPAASVGGTGGMFVETAERQLAAK
jgi:hypothetical protein